MNETRNIAYGFIGVAIGVVVLLTASAPLLIGMGAGTLFAGTFFIGQAILS